VLGSCKVIVIIVVESTSRRVLVKLEFSLELSQISDARTKGPPSGVAAVVAHVSGGAKHQPLCLLTFARALIG